MGWRFALSRFRFSWIELLGVVCATRALSDGGLIQALAVLVTFALAQALLIAWPE